MTSPSRSATLCVVNGGATNQCARVSSAVVILKILRTSDFNQQVASLTRSVTLATVQAAVLPPLLEHRDFIYKEHLQLPIDL